MVKKKKTNIFIKLLIVFFIIYLGLYVINVSGYYEGRIREKTVLTESKIREFESKIQSGEDIDIKSFMDKEEVDYSNNLTVIGDNLTSSIETIISETSKIMGNILKSLF